MRLFLTYFAAAFLSFVFEGVFRYFPFPVLHINIVWILVIFIGLEIPLYQGVFWVFLLGLTAESFGSPFHGLLIFSFLSTYFFLRMIHNRIFLDGNLVKFMWVVILTFARWALESVLLFWQGYPLSFNVWFVMVFSVLEGLAALVLFPLLRDARRVDWEKN